MQVAKLQEIAKNCKNCNLQGKMGGRLKICRSKWAKKKNLPARGPLLAPVACRPRWPWLCCSVAPVACRWRRGHCFVAHWSFTTSTSKLSIMEKNLRLKMQNIQIKNNRSGKLNGRSKPCRQTTLWFVGFGTRMAGKERKKTTLASKWFQKTFSGNLLQKKKAEEIRAETNARGTQEENSHCLFFEKERQVTSSPHTTSIR